LVDLLELYDDARTCKLQNYVVYLLLKQILRIPLSVPYKRANSGHPNCTEI